MSTNTWYAISAKADEPTAEISIYDEIGGWGISAGQFLADISGLKGKHLHVRINSPGGSITEGNAIFNALRRHEGGVTVHIDGMAASMASVIAMAGMPTLIADNAWLMIHNPWTIVAGESDELRKAANLLDGMKTQILGAYVRKTGQSAETLQEMMDQETWLDAVSSVAMGFADAIEEGVEAAANLKPADVRKRFDNFAHSRMSANQALPPEEPTAPVEPTEPTAPVEPTEPTEPTAPVEPTEPSEPQASIGLLDVFARVDALQIENQTLRADLNKAVSEQEKIAQNFFRLKVSLGLAAAADQPVINPPATVANDPVAQYREMIANNASAKERQDFFQLHRDVLVAALGK